ncbi:TatD family hydrolase [Pseudohongiella sp. SYSU M77423]|uniref:TatD family hydrolase n=1 Tax=unclassified Pseudohongiella TaxID=2629611 RepID=UPI001EFF675C|nr:MULTISPECIES: TatD family hydrolase [unclassified Pseudohongiella]MDH7945014.1 TatD family hydrolase [Pseudohongiella sp. SYSU M77423]MEC8858467.1 TatD family hydrolase [Pseudomonadota bacterium]
MNLQLIDIGANLGHESFDHDLEDVLQRAHAAGLVHHLVTGTTLPASQKALALCKKWPDMSATAGIHPHEAQHADAEVLAGIRELLGDPLVKAVGETGLDFNRDFSPRPSQERVFAEHLAMAVDTGKPVFLHQRDAHDRFLPILKEFRDQLSGGVVHCFTDQRQALYDYLDLDMHIGITGWICDERRGAHLHEFVRDIPADRLLLETDAPYLLPRSLRPRPKTRRNEPAWLPEVLRVVAEHCQRPVDQVAAETTANARRLFKLPG